VAVTATATKRGNRYNPVKADQGFKALVHAAMASHMRTVIDPTPSAHNIAADAESPKSGIGVAMMTFENNDRSLVPILDALGFDDGTTAQCPARRVEKCIDIFYFILFYSAEYDKSR